MRLFILMAAAFLKFFTCGLLFWLILLFVFEKFKPVQSQKRPQKCRISSSQNLSKFARILIDQAALSARASPLIDHGGGKILFSRKSSTHSPPTEQRFSRSPFDAFRSAFTLGFTESHRYRLDFVWR